jgi:hypothetical protein
MVLGPLETDPEMILVVIEFVKQAARGTVDSQRVSAPAALYLGSWAQRLQAAGLDPRVVRVGKAVGAPDWSLPVRIWGKKEFRGWIALTRQEGSWVVSDVRLEEATPLSGPFDPESADQEISSPRRR